MLAPSQHFTCASCASAISPTDPRVRCLVCTVPCDMCANCVLGERFKEPHSGTHAVQVLKQSGGPSETEGRVMVPTVPGSTAICYYPPPPVPTLPTESPGRAGDAALEISIAQLSLSSEGEPLRDVAGQVPKGDEIAAPPIQPANTLEQHHSLDSQIQESNGQLAPAATQLPIGDPQQAEFMAFLAQHQAVPPEYHGALHPHDQQMSQVATINAVPSTYQQHVSSFEPPVDTPAHVDTRAAVAPDHTASQDVAPIASSLASPFQQEAQSAAVVSVPQTTEQYLTVVASPPANPPQHVDQPHPIGAPPVSSPENYALPAASVPSSSSQPANGLQAVGSFLATYEQAAPDASPALGSSEPHHQQSDEPHPHTTVAGPPTYHSPAPPTASPAGSLQHVSQLPTAVPPYASAIGSPLTQASQQVAQPVVGDSTQHQPSADVAPALMHRDQAASPAAGYAQPASHPPSFGAAPPTYYPSAPVALPLPSSQHVNQPSAGAATYPPPGSAGSSSATSTLQDHPSTDNVASSMYQPASTAANYASPPSQPPDTATAAAPHQHIEPTASSPPTSVRHADQTSIAAGPPSFYPPASLVESSVTGYARPLPQPASDGAALSTYQSPAPTQVASSPATTAQQINQASAPGAASMYQQGAPDAASPVRPVQQVDGPSFAGAAPPMYHQGAAVSSPFQGANQPSVGAAGPSTYDSTAPVGSAAAFYSQSDPAPSIAGLPTYQSPPPAASAPANSFQPANQPVSAATPPSAYQQPPAATASPATRYAQPIPQLPAGAAAPITHTHASAVGPSTVGSFQQLGRPSSVASANSAFHQYASQTGPQLTGSPATAAGLLTCGIPPALPPRRSAAASGTTGWQPFFLADMSPSPTFVTLLDDVFTYLDPRNLGNMEPEVFSGFLDDLGYMPHENAWKSGLQATYALSAKSMADKSLKNALDHFSIEHILLKRIQPPHEDPTGITAQYKRILGSAFNPSMLQTPGAAYITAEGPMPAITRRGFADVMALEAKAEPAREWGNWSRLLRKYALPRYVGWGDLPRGCFLEYPDPVTVRRVAEIRQVGERQAQEQLDAARAYTQIAAQGRQNALDLISDTTRHEYVYRY